MAPAAGAEAVGVVRESGLVVGFKQAAQYLLKEFIPPGRYSQRPGFAVRLGYVLSANRSPTPPLQPKLFDDALDLLHRHAIDRFAGHTLRHSPIVTVNLPVSLEIEFG